MLDAQIQLAQDGGDSGSFIPMLLMMVAIFALLYFVMIRPQKKRQRQQAEMQNTVDNGTKVVTIGGLYGTVVDSDDDTITLEASEDTFLVFARQAIGRVIPEEEAATETEAAEDPKLTDDDLDKLRDGDDDKKDHGKNY
ncbi:preprotein translocase subunit YajC [Haloglycomyces albus]|uniref:preprotein translocase subunit YajC n=1 Tax=Haloglycomyces albus TaxID=526067 RepID=UPI0004BB6685|nr:preprotein translocase subunit YajC [Haloglycomyces albus]